MSERKRLLLICIDGLGADDLAGAHTPNTGRLAAAGCLAIGAAVIPSVAGHRTFGQAFSRMGSRELRS